MEEYNTATLPHDKYYDLAKYEIRMSAIRMGESVEVNDTYDHNKDMEHMKNSHKRVVVEQDTYLDKGRLENLRKLQNERELVSFFSFLFWRVLRALFAAL